jgi:glycosyltransferase involved in cell wall biosynthesis
MQKYNFSLVLPLFNEQEIVEITLKEILKINLDNDELFEIIIVNDGSNDLTSTILKKFSLNKNINIITHDRNYGYGRALKTGIKNANTKNIFITDIDGTYPNNKIVDFYNKFSEKKCDMLVGARDARSENISLIRKPPKYIINKLANYLVDYKIPDLNSGFRIFKKELFEKFENILPDGFSFTSTITLALLSDYKFVAYEKINYEKRVGKSKIHPIKDTINFVVLILKVIIYFNPLRVFIPLSIITFLIGFILILLRIIIGGQFLVTSIIFIFFATNFLFLGLIADLINKKTRRQ